MRIRKIMVKLQRQLVMHVVVHKFSNFKVVQVIKFKDAEVNTVNVLGSNLFLDF